jgi:toxin ParE1/3/4
MDYKVIYSPNAISDLAEIVRFVAQDDPQAALRLGKQLADDADSLARLPYRFPKFRRRANVRKLVTGQYLILFRIVQTAKVVEYCDFGTERRKTRGCKGEKQRLPGTGICSKCFGK